VLTEEVVVKQLPVSGQADRLTRSSGESCDGRAPADYHGVDAATGHQQPAAERQPRASTGQRPRAGPSANVEADADDATRASSLQHGGGGGERLLQAQLKLEHTNRQQLSSTNGGGPG
jgi:hypothetical protein